jgi:hypothetical protein
MDFMLQFLEFKNLPSFARQWSHRQLKQFQLQILGILRVFLPRCDCQPMVVPLSKILLHYVDSAIRNEGEAVMNNNIKSENFGLVCASLRVVYQFASMGEAYQKALGESSVFDYLLGIKLLYLYSACQ